MGGPATRDTMANFAAFDMSPPPCWTDAQRPAPGRYCEAPDGAGLELPADDADVPLLMAAASAWLRSALLAAPAICAASALFISALSCIPSSEASFFSFVLRM